MFEFVPVVGWDLVASHECRRGGRVVFAGVAHRSYGIVVVVVYFVVYSSDGFCGCYC